LIVNADDFGRTVGINRGIFEAHALGLVTSATLMVNFQAAEGVAAELPRHPKLGVGLHVALTGGSPTLPSSDIPSLVDDRGFLPPKPTKFKTLNPCEVLAEVEAQLDRFRRLTNRFPTHLDSHHHAHRHPVICEALSTVGRRMGLPVRSASPEVHHHLLTTGVCTTDFFVESFFEEGVSQRQLTDTLRGLPAGTTELMCHPGYTDDALRAGSSYVQARERELEVLTDSSILGLCAEEEIQLIHFGSLCES
jgi:predicted glycoside hydrolase/deacetylase ChbG (UPF0249 family)